MIFYFEKYLNGKAKYTNLATKLSTLANQHDEKLAQLKQLVNGYESDKASLDSSSIPGKYYTESSGKVIAYLQEYVTLLTQNQAALESAQQSAKQRSGYYADLYNSEVQREKAYRAQEAARKKREQEKQK